MWIAQSKRCFGSARGKRPWKTAVNGYRYWRCTNIASRENVSEILLISRAPRISSPTARVSPRYFVNSTPLSSILLSLSLLSNDLSLIDFSIPSDSISVYPPISDAKGEKINKIRKERERKRKNTIILLVRCRAAGGRNRESHKHRQIDLQGKAKARREPEIFSYRRTRWSGSLKENAKLYSLVSSGLSRGSKRSRSFRFREGKFRSDATRCGANRDT